MKENHKSFLLLLVLVVIVGSQVFLSCRKKPLPPPNPPPINIEPCPELEITYPEGIIPYGENNIVFSWTANNAKHVYINGVKQSSSTSGEYVITERVLKDFTINFRALNISKEIKKDVTVRVGDWKSSLHGLISYHPWEEDTIKFWKKGSLYKVWVIPEEDKIFTHHFLINGELETRLKDGPGVAKGRWSFSKDKTKINIGKGEVDFSLDEEYFRFKDYAPSELDGTIMDVEVVLRACE
ncbi:MAG: hypothetical protein WBK97_08520 [Bacteroidales bacterium]|jgi:hypothetical protein